MLAIMRRITVKLPDDLDAKLRHEAARRESTIADVMREAVEAHVAGVAGRRLIAAKRDEAELVTRRAASKRSSGARPGDPADRRIVSS
jgi:predicted transcriptional regulator